MKKSIKAIIAATFTAASVAVAVVVSAAVVVEAVLEEQPARSAAVGLQYCTGNGMDFRGQS